MQGVISDIDGDDTIMGDNADVTVTIDLSNLPPEQALTIAKEADMSGQDPYALGRLMKGEGDQNDLDNLQDAEFHLPLGAGLTILSQMGVLDIPEEPPEDVDVSEVAE